MGETPEDNPMASATIPQLNGLKKNLEHEIKQLNENYETLNMGYQRIKHSCEALKQMKKADGEAMIPMTSSVYMRGKINANHVNKVLIDVGTGYFIEKPIEGAYDYCQRRADMLHQNVAGTQKLCKQKMQQAEMVTMNINNRMQMEEAQGAQQ